MTPPTGWLEVRKPVPRYNSSKGAVEWDYLPRLVRADAIRFIAPGCSGEGNEGCPKATCYLNGKMWVDGSAEDLAEAINQALGGGVQEPKRGSE